MNDTTVELLNFDVIEDWDFGNKNSEFLKIESGEEVKIRMVKDFVIVDSYFLKDIKRSIRLPYKTKTPRTLAEYSKSIRVFTWVLDRKDEDKLKKFEMPITAFLQIRELKKMEDWAFAGLPHYDINIKKTGKGLETKYIINPSPKSTPLTEEQQKIVSEEVTMHELIHEMMEGDRKAFSDAYGYDLFQQKKELTTADVESVMNGEDPDLNIDDLPF